jgi:UDP-GlcNAc3NAcA epimerase
LRDTTEWTETVDLGWNRLVGLEPDGVLAGLEALERPSEHPELYGGGRAGKAIVTELEQFAHRAGRAA